MAGPPLSMTGRCRLYERGRLPRMSTPGEPGQPHEYCAVHDQRISRCKLPDRCRETMRQWGLYQDEAEGGRRPMRAVPEDGWTVPEDGWYERDPSAPHGWRRLSDWDAAGLEVRGIPEDAALVRFETGDDGIEAWAAKTGEMTALPDGTLLLPRTWCIVTGAPRLRVISENGTPAAGGIPWHAVVSVQRADGGCIGPVLAEPAAKALAAAAASDPALSAVTATAMIRPAVFGAAPEPDVLVTEMTVLADGPVHAAVKAWGLVAVVLWELDGWELEHPSVSAAPVAAVPGLRWAS